MDDSKVFFLGFGTLALGEFLAYHWSPDYQEFVSNGNNFLWFVGIVAITLIGFTLIDMLYAKEVKDER